MSISVEKKKVLLVCLGNICRSPMAEGILRDLAEQQGLAIETDSAGTGSSHVGEAPDPRAQREMRRRGHDISDLRARRFRASDFEQYDLLLAMDRQNLRDMQRLAPSPELAGKARLMLEWAANNAALDVPDPWYGGEEGFAEVYHMLAGALDNLVAELAGDAS